MSSTSRINVDTFDYSKVADIFDPSLDDPANCTIGYLKIRLTESIDLNASDLSGFNKEDLHKAYMDMKRLKLFLKSQEMINPRRESSSGDPGKIGYGPSDPLAYLVPPAELASLLSSELPKYKPGSDLPKLASLASIVPSGDGTKVNTKHKEWLAVLLPKLSEHMNLSIDNVENLLKNSETLDFSNTKIQAWDRWLYNALASHIAASLLAEITVKDRTLRGAGFKMWRYIHDKVTEKDDIMTDATLEQHFYQVKYTKSMEATLTKLTETQAQINALGRKIKTDRDVLDRLVYIATNEESLAVDVRRALLTVTIKNIAEFMALVAKYEKVKPAGNLMNITAVDPKPTGKDLPDGTVYWQGIHCRKCYSTTHHSALNAEQCKITPETKCGYEKCGGTGHNKAACFKLHGMPPRGRSKRRPFKAAGKDSAADKGESAVRAKE
jgi:hypothetical protein